MSEMGDISPVSGRSSDNPPPWQATIEFTVKGTEEECDEMIAKLRAYARRLGITAEFCESEPNADLGYPNAR